MCIRDRANTIEEHKHIDQNANWYESEGEIDAKGHGRISFPKKYDTLPDNQTKSKLEPCINTIKDNGLTASNENLKDIKYYDLEDELEPCTLLYTVRDEAEERIELLQKETRQISEEFRREIAEKNEYIMSQVLREEKIHKEYQELLNTQTMLVMQKVTDAIQSAQSAQSEHINSLVETLSQHLSKFSESKSFGITPELSLIHICRCRRIERCRSRWSPYH
eukprot:TRINITY_DN22836_c0_g1_i2.p1 TRINITY_DN22836_c0_g1~~TRINITY_DN22836_c0_g1_i2.p1  ORF type:complete len:221 (-),score=40.39 TRINITY_DN22836_c0_g1_i2:15-677(-)